MNSARGREASRSQDRAKNNDGILEQKKKSLVKIGVSLKADKNQVPEGDEMSEDSAIRKKYENTMKAEKVTELSKRLHKEAEQKAKLRKDMATDKEKVVLGECSFKPQVNKLTSRQRQFRSSRFAGKDSLDAKYLRAQTADPKKAFEKPINKSKPTEGNPRKSSISKSAEKVPHQQNKQVSAVHIKPLDLYKIGDDGDKSGNILNNPIVPYEMSDDGQAKYQSHIQLKPMNSDRQLNQVGAENNELQPPYKDGKQQQDVFNYLSVKGSLIEKKKALDLAKKQKELEECTFVPKINKPRAKTMKRNESIAKDKKEPDTDRFTQLYKQQRAFEKYNKDAIEAELKYCTFQPELDKKSRKMIEKNVHTVKKE